MKLKITDERDGREEEREFDITPEDLDRWYSGNYTFEQCFPNVRNAEDCFFLIQYCKFQTEKKVSLWDSLLAKLTSWRLEK